MATNLGPEIAAPMYEADYLDELYPLQILVEDYDMLPSTSVWRCFHSFQIVKAVPLLLAILLS